MEDGVDGAAVGEEGDGGDGEGGDLDAELELLVLVLVAELVLLSEQAERNVRPQDDVEIGPGT